MIRLQPEPDCPIFAVPYRGRTDGEARELPAGVIVRPPTREQRDEVPDGVPMWLEMPGDPDTFIKLTGVYVLATGEVAAIYGAEPPIRLKSWREKTVDAARKVAMKCRKDFPGDIDAPAERDAIKAAVIRCARLAIDPEWDPPEDLPAGHRYRPLVEAEPELIDRAIKFRAVIEAELIDLHDAMIVENFMVVIQRELAELLDD